MSRHKQLDDHEPTFFSDLERAALDGAFVATTNTPLREIELAHVGFSAELMVYEHGRSGYQEVELSAFSIGPDDPERYTKRVTREALNRDWIVLPADCRSGAHYLWARGTREKPEPGKPRKWLWFASPEPQRFSEFEDHFRARQARESIRNHLIYSLSLRIDFLQRHPGRSEAFA